MNPNNFFIKNSILPGTKCGWVDCNNVVEPLQTRCEHHLRAEKNNRVAKLSPKQKLVYDVIKDYPEAANDDAVLLANVWLREGWMGGAMVLEECLRRVSRPETLSRRRRELFNMGLIEYSEKSLKRRTKAFLNERDRASPRPPQIKSRLTTTDGEPMYVKAHYDKNVTPVFHSPRASIYRTNEVNMITKDQKELLQSILEAATDNWGQVSPDLVVEIMQEYLGNTVYICEPDDAQGHTVLPSGRSWVDDVAELPINDMTTEQLEDKGGAPITIPLKTPVTQQQTIDFVKDPENIRKAVEGSMDKRLKDNHESK